MSRTTIILHDEEIRGLLDGTRTQLRRPVVPPKGYPYPEEFDIYAKVSRVSGGWVESSGEYDIDLACPFGATGARLAVREAFAIHSHPQEGQGCGYWIEYKADGSTVKWAWNPAPAAQWAARADRGWLSAATMPRWACRYELEVGEVRCQRLQDSTEDDAIAEGCRGDWVDRGITVGWEVSSAVEALTHRWEARHGERHPWSSDPWTFVATGRLVAL